VLVLGYALINSLWKTAPNINTTLVNDQELISRINDNGLTFKVAANPNFNVIPLLFRNIILQMLSLSLMFKHQINNNYINVQHLESKQLSQIHLTSELHIPSVQDQLLIKEIVHRHMLLLQLEPLLIDFAFLTKKTIQNFLLKHH
jgi:hypothetical protein